MTQLTQNEARARLDECRAVIDSRDQRIRDARYAGLAVKEIGDRLGLSRQQVYAILEKSEGPPAGDSLPETTAGGPCTPIVSGGSS